MIQKQIVQELKHSMLNKNTELTKLIRTIIGEFNRIGKDISDEEAIAKLLWLKNNAIIMKNQFEIDYLSKFIPERLSEDKIKIIIQTIIKDNGLTAKKEIGNVMTLLKNHPQSALIDNAIASKITKEILYN
jgi:uncharacterized protein YqeY